MDGASCSRYSRSDWSQAWTRAESSQSMVSSDFSPLLYICVCVCARARARACARQFLTSLNLQHSHATAMHVCIGQVTLACSLLLLTPCTPATAHHVQCDTKKTKNWEFGRDRGKITLKRDWAVSCGSVTGQRQLAQARQAWRQRRSPSR